jgi:hypothetical protein
MFLPSQRDTPETYRLVIRYPAGHTICAPEFRGRKQAIARVAQAARKANHAGRALGIVLERTQPAGNGDNSGARTAGTQIWTPVERWGPDVIRRILEQGGGDPPDRVAVKPEVAAKTSACEQGTPAPGARPPKARAGHRWQVALVVGLTLLTWSIVTLLLTGGGVLSPGPRAADAVATTLPLAAPASRANAKTLPVPAVPSGLGTPAESQPRGTAGGDVRRW